MFSLSRRQLLQSTSCGFGMLALAGMLDSLGLRTNSAQAASEGANPLLPRQPHFPAKAKRVIFMFMQGAPSHVDTFDYKPQLEKDDGKTAGAGKGNRKLLKSPFTFNKSGNSGLPISELFPNLSQHADDLCLLNSLHCDLPNHPQASVQMHTGSFQFVRPSMGAWVLYGLGTENQELPGFITLNPVGRIGGAQNYGSSFLPAAFQGTKIGGDGVSLANASVPNIASRGVSKLDQRTQLDLLQELNRERLGQDKVNRELEGIIESYELAFKMQSAVPKLMNISDESPSTLEAYGIGVGGGGPMGKKGGGGGTDNFGRQCLLARRFAEAGVRFIELSHPGWDQHQQLRARLTANANAIDKPIAALINDLKQRGMLKDTLLIWGGEFGRTPHAQNEDGRDHNATGFSMWMAGGGVKGGLRYGATDEHGIKAEENKMHVHDFHATVLHLLGLDHTRLTYNYSGRDFRLTEVHGNVAKEILA